jgi:hypothetical protein
LPLVHCSLDEQSGWQTALMQRNAGPPQSVSKVHCGVAGATSSEHTPPVQAWAMPQFAAVVQLERQVPLTQLRLVPHWSLAVQMTRFAAPHVLPLR